MTTPEQARELAEFLKRANFHAESEVISDLARQVEELQADAERYRVVKGMVWFYEEDIVFRVQNDSVDSSVGYALSETLDNLR